MKILKASHFFILILLGLLLVLPSCARPKKIPSARPGHPPPYKIGNKWYYPLKEARSFRERGTASWYGKDFHGRKTSNGEVYDMYAMTGAHKTLPFGTYVRVDNLENGKKVDVRINDRGPFVRGRIIDLSYRAAKEIGLVGPGTAPVKIMALGIPEETRVHGKVKRTLVPGNYYAGNFAVQVGAFRDRTNALRVREKVAEIHKDAYITVYESREGKYYRVRAAKCTTLDQARRYQKRLEEDGYRDAFVVVP
ncbi:MAG: septal ring lytic transglycosylase RlpA family protein [Thermodesulfobacteriota bacterium]|nr:septal ring lytic transglycosylase RlpA family protein [Thermodesulfobacteriota bacterium]